MKNKQIYWAVAAIVIIIAIIWAYKAKHEVQQAPVDDSLAQLTVDQPSQATATASQTKNTWLGQLKKSDNSTKGNLMLITKDRTIYMKTSRDFSALLDKNISVTYEGTWQNFVLGDVTLAEQQ